MKKVLKVVGIVILCFILIWALYVTVEAIRLRTMKLGLEPLISLERVEDDTKLYYKGLGYSVTYQIHKEQNYDLILTRILGGEFRLFDKILIWAWIE